MRSTVLTGAVIGDNCLIAAGAVVSENSVIPPNSLVVGSTQSKKRNKRNHKLQIIKYTWENYVEYLERYF